MYFWNINALKEEIKRGNFGDSKVIAYIVISLFLYYVVDPEKPIPKSGQPIL